MQVLPSAIPEDLHQSADPPLHTFGVMLLRRPSVQEPRISIDMPPDPRHRIPALDAAPFLSRRSNFVAKLSYESMPSRAMQWPHGSPKKALSNAGPPGLIQNRPMSSTEE